jgi:hypothetical protein
MNATSSPGSTVTRPAWELEVRTALPRVRLRAAVDGRMPTLVGHFASFNEWTEIRSSVEGHLWSESRLVPSCGRSDGARAARSLRRRTMASSKTPDHRREQYPVTFIHNHPRRRWPERWPIRRSKSARRSRCTPLPRQPAPPRLRRRLNKRCGCADFEVR